MGCEMGKGQSFEREFSRRLSLWWTRGERDDVFWRTPGSGAQSTARRQSGKPVDVNIVGDIMAVDPVGEPLVRQVMFELKNGYGYIRLVDLMQPNSKFWRWIGKLTLDANQYGVEWVLVHRYRSQSIMVLSNRLSQRITHQYVFFTSRLYSVHTPFGTVALCSMNDFFEIVPPEIFAEIEK